MDVVVIWLEQVGRSEGIWWIEHGRSGKFLRNDEPRGCEEVASSSSKRGNIKTKEVELVYATLQKKVCFYLPRFWSIHEQLSFELFYLILFNSTTLWWRQKFPRQSFSLGTDFLHCNHQTMAKLKHLPLLCSTPLLLSAVAYIFIPHGLILWEHVVGKVCRDPVLLSNPTLKKEKLFQQEHD